MALSSTEQRHKSKPFFSSVLLFLRLLQLIFGPLLFLQSVLQSLLLLHRRVLGLSDLRAARVLVLWRRWDVWAVPVACVLQTPADVDVLELSK